MRVFTPVKEYILNQNKFCEGCLLMNGRLHHRLIAAKCAFFYPESYEGVDEAASQKDFNRAVMCNIRWHAAINKTPQKSTAVVFTADELSKKLTAHPVVVTQAEHLNSNIQLLWDLFKQMGSLEYAQAMKFELEAARPDLKYGPQSSPDGITNFMDFSEPVADDKAELLCDEIKSTYDHIEPNVTLVKMIHAQLCKGLNQW